jgi:predicted DCC family thiol-disulfide oxidoreductase YuxK
MWQSSRGSNAESVVVVFDGHCNLCSATVSFLLQHDRTGMLRFTSFQQQSGIDSPPETVYVIVGEMVLQESEAALYLIRFLGPWWQPLRLFGLIPSVIRNPVYRWIARNRYRWFGRRSTCRLPEPHEIDRFI